MTPGQLNKAANKYGQLRLDRPYYIIEDMD